MTGGDAPTAEQLALQLRSTIDRVHQAYHLTRVWSRCPQAICKEATDMLERFGQELPG